MNQIPNIEEEQASEPIYDTDCGCCMKPETKKGYEYQSKYNTREVEEYKKGLAKVCELSGIHMCPGCGITPEGLDILIHHQLQKARGGDIHFKVTEYGTKKVDNMIAESVQKARETLITEVREMLDFEGVLSMSVEKGFQEIIDRYHSELDQDKK